MNETESASYTDDNTPQTFTGSNVEDVIINLQNASLTLFQWFYDNQMKANPGKRNLICSTSGKVNIIAENQKQITVHAKSSQVLDLIQNKEILYKKE